MGEITSLLLSSNLHQGYGVDILEDERDDTVQKHQFGILLLIIIIVCGVLAFYYFKYRSRENQKILSAKYIMLLEKAKTVDERRL